MYMCVLYIHHYIYINYMSGVTLKAVIYSSRLNEVRAFLILKQSSRCPNYFKLTSEIQSLLLNHQLTWGRVLLNS